MYVDGEHIEYKRPSVFLKRVLLLFARISCLGMTYFHSCCLEFNSCKKKIKRFFFSNQNLFVPLEIQFSLHYTESIVKVINN